MKRNSQIQRNGTNSTSSDDIIYDDESSGEFDEHKQLLSEALKESDVIAAYNST